MYSYCFIIRFYFHCANMLPFIILRVPFSCVADMRARHACQRNLSLHCELLVCKKLVHHLGTSQNSQVHMQAAEVHQQTVSQALLESVKVCWEGAAVCKLSHVNQSVARHTCRTVIYAASSPLVTPTLPFQQPCSICISKSQLLLLTFTCS